MNKKASFELTSEALVIIILGIAMLTLGLGFIYNYFNPAANQIGTIENQIGNEIIDNLKQSNSRLTIKNIEIGINTKNNDIVEYFALFNNLKEDCTFDLSNAIKCTNEVYNNTERNDLQISTFKTVLVKANEHKILPLNINIDSKSLSDIYACSITISKDMLEDCNNDLNGNTFANSEFFIRIK